LDQAHDAPVGYAVLHNLTNHPILTDGARRLHAPAQTFFGSGLALSYLKDID